MCVCVFFFEVMFCLKELFADDGPNLLFALIVFSENASEPLIKMNIHVSNLQQFWVRDCFSKACFI